jgi:hypothetical protein
MRCGSSIRYVLDADEAVERSQPRPIDSSLAAANFEMGEYLHRGGDHAAPVEHWKSAHSLQAWNLEAPDSVRTVDAYGSGWLDDVRAQGAESYFPPLRP